MKDVIAPEVLVVSSKVVETVTAQALSPLPGLLCFE